MIFLESHDGKESLKGVSKDTCYQCCPGVSLRCLDLFNEI